MSFTPHRDYDVPTDKIEQLRTRIYEYARSHPEEIDIEDVRSRIAAPEDIANNNLDPNNNLTTNWMLKRFLIFNHKDVDQAFEKAVESFTFRTNQKLSSLRIENCLPIEFFELVPLIKEGKDREGNSIVLIKLRFYKKIAQFDHLIKRGVMFYFEQVDKEYELGNCNGLCLTLDCSGFAISNVDLDLLQWLVKTVPGYYIGLVRNVLIYETPFLLRYIFKVVEGWLPSIIDKNTGQKRALFHTVDKKTVDDFIETNELENVLAKKELVAPKGVVPFLEMIKMIEGVKEENIKRIDAHIQQLKAA